MDPYLLGNAVIAHFDGGFLLEVVMLTQERVRESFEYRDGKLYWKMNKGPNARIGDRAGWKAGKLPYRLIRIDRRNHGEHRLVYLYFHGYIPNEIDHISDDLTSEGIKSNLIKNLRAITRARNVQRTIKIRESTSKYRGVSWHKRDKIWRATIGCRHLGYFKNELNAASAYNNAALEYYGKYCFINKIKGN